MKTLLLNSIDWMSIKLNAVSLLGLFSGETTLVAFAGIATGTTIIYNAIRIFKEIRNFKKD
jgi:hypothetical protein